MLPDSLSARNELLIVKRGYYAVAAHDKVLGLYVFCEGMYRKIHTFSVSDLRAISAVIKATMVSFNRTTIK